MTENGIHEGYLVPQFGDGQRGQGVISGGMPVDRVVSGSLVEGPDGAWGYPSRPAAEVTGWVVCCDCSQPGSFQARTWVGPVLTRAASAELEDLGARRVYAADIEVAYVGDRPEVEAVAYDLWRAEHAYGSEAIEEVKDAACLAAMAKERLDAAVSLARASGVDSTEITRAAGVRW